MAKERKKKTIIKKDSITKAKALKIVEFIKDFKGIKPVALYIGAVSTLCDYFIICSGDSTKHVQGIYSGVVKKCQENNIAVDHCEDDSIGHWIVIDLSDVMIHVFDEDSRKFYNLEKLWSHGKKIRCRGNSRLPDGQA